MCVVTDYTAEAGVRNLERMLGTVCRAVAVKVWGAAGYGVCVCEHLAVCRLLVEKHSPFPL